MTTPNGNILFNSTTGSDTQASGLGPATAVSFTLQTTAGSNVATVSSGSFTSISIGDLMFIPDAAFTGRKFNIISNITPVTNEITFDNNWDDTSSSTTGYVGGKRATIDNADSRRLLGFQNVQDLPSLCWVELETDQTITSTVNGRGARRIKSSSGSRKTITFDFFPNYYWAEIGMSGGGYFDNINFDTTNPLIRFGQASTGGYEATNYTYFFNCSLRNFSSMGAGFSRQMFVIALNTYFENISSPGAYGFATDSFNGSQCYVDANKCFFKNCGALNNASTDSYASVNRSEINDCVFLGDGTKDFSLYRLATIKNSIISNYRYFSNISADSILATVKNCVIHNVTSILNLDNATRNIDWIEMSDNYFYNVGSFSNVSGLENYIGQNNTTLTTDPLQIQNGNVQLTNSAGGGYTVRNAEIKL